MNPFKALPYFFKRHFSITGIPPFTKVIQSTKAVREVKIRKSILKFPLLDMISQWVQRLGYGMDNGVLFPAGTRDFFFPWCPCRFECQPRVLSNGNPGFISPERQGREADHSPPSSAEVKNG
jgi:hypothetical protein